VHIAGLTDSAPELVLDRMLAAYGILREGRNPHLPGKKALRLQSLSSSGWQQAASSPLLRHSPEP